MEGEKSRVPSEIQTHDLLIMSSTTVQQMFQHCPAPSSIIYWKIDAIKQRMIEQLSHLSHRLAAQHLTEISRTGIDPLTFKFQSSNGLGYQLF